MLDVLFYVEHTPDDASNETPTMTSIHFPVWSFSFDSAIVASGTAHFCCVSKMIDIEAPMSISMLSSFPSAFISVQNGREGGVLLEVTTYEVVLFFPRDVMLQHSMVSTYSVHYM